MNPKIILLLLAMLAMAFANYPGVIEEKKISTANNFQKFEEINMSILEAAGECFGVNLTANISCEKYDFNRDKTLDIRDLVTYTRNESLKTEVDISR